MKARRSDQQLQFGGMDHLTLSPADGLWLAKRAAWRAAEQDGWVLVGDRTVPWNRFTYWGSLLAWPEPMQAGELVVWAVCHASEVTVAEEATIAVRFGLTQAATLAALREREATTKVWHGAFDWSFGSREFAIIDFRQLAARFSQVLGEVPYGPDQTYLDSRMHAAIETHVLEGPYGAMLVTYCFYDGNPNAFLRQLNRGAAWRRLADGPPRAVTDAAVACAANAREYAWILDRAQHRLHTLALRRAAPTPWHWPPWAATGMPMPDPTPVPLVRSPPAPKQLAFPTDDA